MNYTDVYDALGQDQKCRAARVDIFGDRPIASGCGKLNGLDTPVAKHHNTGCALFWGTYADLPIKSYLIAKALG